MKVLIIEDEGIAAERLIQLLNSQDSNIEILDQLDSIKATVKWFINNPAPDLAFFDIQLADGLSFEIFEKIEVNCPIIFATAYDQYAIKAFKVNSIDYLLKPIVPDDLKNAIHKFQSSTVQKQDIDTQSLINLIQNQSKTFKERFVIKVGEHLKSVLAADINIFYSHEKTIYLQDSSGQKFILDYTLDQIEEMVDPQKFFRASRKYIIHIDSITDIITYSNSRLKLELSQFDTIAIIVSRERVAQFKNWLDR